MQEPSIRNLRGARRYNLQLQAQYHVSQKGLPPRTGSGTTCDMSTTGLSFRSRKPLPVGAHIEMVIDWPATYGDYPVSMQVTGFIVRSDASRTAVRITSHRFRVAAVQHVRATA